MALTYNELDAHVRNHHLPGLVNNVFVGTPVLAKMMSNGSVRLKGGKAIEKSILYGRVNSGAYTGIGKFNIQPVEVSTLGVWKWKSRYANITLSKRDLDMASGEDAVLDLLATQMMSAENTIKEDIETDLLVGIATENDPEFEGFITGIDDGTSYPSHGGISCDDMPTWKGVVDATGGAVTVSRVNNYIGACTYGQEVPDLIITTQTILDALKAQVQPLQRFLDGKTPLAKLGFDGIQFGSKTQIIASRLCPEGYMFGINTNYYNFYLHTNCAFAWTEEKPIIDGAGYCRQILIMGNFFTIARRYHFKASGLTA